MSRTHNHNNIRRPTDNLDDDFSNNFKLSSSPSRIQNSEIVSNSHGFYNNPSSFFPLVEEKNLRLVSSSPARVMPTLRQVKAPRRKKKKNRRYEEPI